ncbi:MAG: PEGA domain-containing protein [Bdellovibrionota bacterium]
MKQPVFKRIVLSFFPALLGAAALGVFPGCASIFNQTKQEVLISSEPGGALIRVNGIERGRTPVGLRLKRKQRNVVRLELEGYVPYEIQLHREVSGWFFGNLILGGLVGMAIDAGTGGMYSLEPEEVQTRLTAKSVSTVGDENPDGDALYLFVVMRADPSWRKVGQLEAVRHE